MSTIPAALARALSGRYHIEQEVGAGGAATVFRARDLKHDRDVAVKLLRPEVAEHIGRDRFQQEITLAAQLSHPHILSLIDSGDADGSVYYIMPFIAGETLRQRLAREGRLPLADAVRLACQIADALAFAHRRGVVHRDIKPENILLQEGHALVADFGIALAAHTTREQRLTQAGFSLGTPAYMSPEQVTGEQEIDARSERIAWVASCMRW